MTLIKSISGIRGTIGGHVGEGLNPLDIVKFTSAYATLIRKTTTVKSNKIVVGRDARISGEMVKNVVCGTLMGMGFDVVNICLLYTSHEMNIGDIRTDMKTYFQVAVKDGFINVLTLQLAGKKRMNVADFLRGYRTSDNNKVE